MVKELVQKNNNLIRMNKVRAYRELQKKQGTFQKLWTEDSPGVAAQPTLTYRNTVNKRISGDSAGNSNDTDNGVMHSMKRLGPQMFTLSRNIDMNRPLSRAHTSRFRHIYREPGRPVTAPETNAYATLDGPRQEMTSQIAHRTRSVRSNVSDTESLSAFPSKSFNPKRKLRSSFELIKSIDSNDNEKLITQQTRANEQSSEDTIQYPSASRMREMLAHDGQIPIPLHKAFKIYSQNHNTITNGDTNGSVNFRGITARNSRTSAQSKFSENIISNGNHSRLVSQGSPEVQTTRDAVHSSIPKSGIIRRASSQVKQVSFVSDENEMDKPLALTQRNLEMYNAMVLRTIRTSKFDERVVKWVMERQYDHRSRVHQHDVILEVDETKESPSNFNGRTTPSNKALLDDILLENAKNREKSTLNGMDTTCTINAEDEKPVTFAYPVEKKHGANQTEYKAGDKRDAQNGTDRMSVNSTSNHT